MPKFKVGDRISNGKTEYTVLNIETNNNGNLCYRFNNPASKNFLWVTSQVDQMFELVEDNDYNYWKDFRAKAAKDILCSVILTFEPDGNFKQSLDNAINSSIEAADRLIFKLQEKKPDDLQNRVVKAISNKYQDLCKTCKHYWQDFTMPSGRMVSHCEILDRQPGIKEMDTIVPYPCIKCPFDSYSEK